MSIVQSIAIVLLFIYVAGAIIYVSAFTTFLVQRKRNPEISPFVDVLARIIAFIQVAVFWPVDLLFRR